MQRKKNSAFALLEILKKESDAEHPLSQKRVAELLEMQYGIVLERRAFYNNFDMLQTFGYDISTWHDNGHGYYLKSRQFDEAEVLLLCNALHASHFISKQQSDALINKLLATQSRYQQKEFRDAVYLPNMRKTENTTLFESIRIISKANHNGHKVSFTYMHYNADKKLVPFPNNPHIADPRFIVYNDERAYMIATTDAHPGFRHYRIDRMCDVKELEEKSEPLPEELDAYQYAENKLFMFGGEPIYVTLRIRADIIGQMIDLFGKNINFIPNGDCYDFTVRAARRGILILAQQYIDQMEILEPADLRGEIKKTLQEALQRYQ